MAEQLQNPQTANGAEPGTPTDPNSSMLAPYDPFADHRRLLQIFERCKKEAFENRWVWERDWLRDLYYIDNRQWITYQPAQRQWINKTLQPYVPKPVTNKMAETLQAIRTTFGAIDLAPTVVPVGNDGRSVAAAEVADQMAPLIHEEHKMDQTMREADFWLIVNGSVVLQTSWDLDQRSNRIFTQSEQCSQCLTINKPQDIKAAGDTCPSCGFNQFIPAVDEQGKEVGEWKAFGKGKTVALSPFEFAFPQNFTRWDDLPYIIRLRWRDKHWFEANRPDLVPKMQWEKQPSDRSLAIFKSLATTNDLGTSSGASYFGAGGGDSIEGVTEYELWMKPTPEFPDGLVVRVVGDKQPFVLDVQNESLPGPFPYTDIEGRPLFPFSFAQYEQIGGRLYGRSALSPLIQKQDQLNQLDSLILMTVQRMANPAWVIPEDAGIEKMSGEPGLVIKWRPLATSGNHKPERIAGSEVPSSLWNLRQQILDDIESLAGTYDIIKGQKPTGIEAFSALQLLVERSQSRFGSVFKARGEMYRQWFSVALELERQFGPNERVMSLLGPNRGYAFERFENAQLQGQVTVKIEDGSQNPKTSLGRRAAIEQAAQLMLLNPADTDQQYILLSQLGLADIAPGLNTHVQKALQVQDSFEKWALNPVGPPPLEVKPWFDAKIHFNERIKWLNTDKMSELLTTNPLLEQLVTEHLMELQMILAQQISADQSAGQAGPTGGGGQAMSNSNANSGSPKSLPKGNNQKTAQNAGPI